MARLICSFTNSAGLARGLYRNEFDPQLVSAAGPAFTLLQGVVAYLFIRAGSAGTSFAFLLFGYADAILAAVVRLAS